MQKNKFNVKLFVLLPLVLAITIFLWVVPTSFYGIEFGLRLADAVENVCSVEGHSSIRLRRPDVDVRDNPELDYLPSHHSVLASDSLRQGNRIPMHS